MHKDNTTSTEIKMPAPMSLLATMKDIHPDQLLTPEQTGDILGLKPATLAVWRSTQRYPLKFIKIGRWVRYRWSDVLEFIDQRTRSHIS